MQTNVISQGDVTLETEERRLTVRGDKHQLTPKECDLLALMMRNPNRLLSHSEIMQRVWETDFVDDTRTLQVHVCWLREKIEINRRQPAAIVTIRGQGYRFETKGAQSERMA